MDDTLQQAVLEAISDVLNDHQENGTLANLSTEQLNNLAAMLQDSGFFNLLLTEDLGGAGLNLQQSLAIFLQEGVYALPIALTSTNLANAWLHAQGLSLPGGVVAIESVTSVQGQKGLVTIGLKPQSYIHTTPYILLAASDQVYIVDTSAYQTEPVDSDTNALWLTLNLSGAQTVGVSDEAVKQLHDLAVLSSIATSVGAMRQVLEMAVQYAAERSQFGRKLSQFQAIQQQLSLMVECVCSAQMAAELAFYSQDAVPHHKHIMLAKHQISLVANQVANIAHAVHGAIGITKEFPLHFYTQIIRQNRSRGGSELYWAEQLGSEVLQSDKTLLALLSEDLLVS